MARELRTATAYEALGVNRCAPVELISASYWNLVKELRARRKDDPRINTLLLHAQRAYETLSDPVMRTIYDHAIGHQEKPLINRKFKGPKGTWLGGLLGRRPGLEISADPYEVMGLHSTALEETIPDAYRIMKLEYLSLPADSRRRAELLRLLDQSFAVLNDPQKRAFYEGEAVAPSPAQTAALPVQEPGPAAAAKPPAKAKPAAPTDKAKPPETVAPVPVTATLRQTGKPNKAEIEAVMLGRLEARMTEVAAYAGSSAPPGDADGVAETTDGA